MHGKRIIFGGPGSGKTIQIQNLVLESLTMGRNVLFFCRAEESAAVVARAKATVKGLCNEGMISQIPLAGAASMLQAGSTVDDFLTARLAIVTIDPYNLETNNPEIAKTQLANVLETLDREHRFADPPNKRGPFGQVGRNGKIEIREHGDELPEKVTRYHVFLDSSELWLRAESIELLLPDNATITSQSFGELNNVLGHKGSDSLVEGFRECEFFRCADLMTAEKAAELSEGRISPCEIRDLRPGASLLIGRTVQRFDVSPPRRTCREVIMGLFDRLLLGGAYALYKHDRAKSIGNHS